jgi:hypothetical protein
LCKSAAIGAAHSKTVFFPSVVYRRGRLADGGIAAE